MYNTIVVFWYKSDGYDRADAIFETIFKAPKSFSREEISLKLEEVGYNHLEYDFFIIKDHKYSGELK